MDWLGAYRIYRLPPGKFLVRHALPTILVGAFLGFALFTLLSAQATLVRIGALLGPMVVATWVALMLPRIQADRLRKEMDNRIHFYITHMGVLATARLPPVDILEKLGEKKEYGALSEASAQIASLVRRWNMSLPEACRFVAERSPSVIFDDFLERFAYAIETGEDLTVFLKSEQNVVIGDYSTAYQADLYAVDSVKDMFMSTLMSVIFLIILILITPMLTGIELGATAWGLVGMVLFLEVLFLLMLMARAPNDSLWTEIKHRIGLRKELDLHLPLTLGLCVLAGLAAWRFTQIDPPFLLAISTTPLAILGFAVAKHENGIRRKDDNYHAFIRSLGSSTSARGGSPRSVLKRLHHHDFGPLTKDVKSLYRRLHMRLGEQEAWNRFANETSSNLIEKFTAMFIEGINAGGDAEEIGLIVSDNAVKILALRKHRHQTSQGYRGMLLGLTAGIAGSLFMGVGLIEVLGGLFTSGMAGDAETIAGVGLDIGQADAGLMGALVTIIVVIHVFVAATMMSLVSGGSKYLMAAYIPLFAWVAAIAAFLSMNMMQSLSL
jgi:archaeal flagellar protein FlaJ